MNRPRYLTIRAATGEQESLPVSHDETDGDLLAILREWAGSRGEDAVCFRIDGREYRFFLDSEPQEVL